MKIKLTVFTLLISIHIVSPFIDQILPNYNFQRLAEAEAIQKEKNKVQIIGYGKTRGQAFMDAQKNAKKISYHYREISRSYSGTEGNWTCILIIEY
ncbi:MAG: hypothetical protein U9Q92_02790 [archaeon]|nr:hypothetical protein [archaeon]